MTYLTASPRRRQTRDQARSFDRLDRILATIPDHRQQPGRRDRAARVRDVVVDQAALDAANHPLGGLKRGEYQKILDAYYAGQRRIEKEPTPVGDHCAGLATLLCGAISGACSANRRRTVRRDQSEVSRVMEQTTDDRRWRVISFPARPGAARRRGAEPTRRLPLVAH